ncbi:2-oxo-4-hydroxy-4-carboxy-5-ureidoimidazoline decarboxylase [Actinocrispum wychmicini]|uniref:OHCU decarboxylase n=1 Tax=Actinocrispum wychmicini TaxID=1213861 RepID=A0A4R2JL57_9PSEU|nr:2-oxo-4-hydroxy-4-carboxy-5-ureidoimidazoline decarboxylase [Actinocrispum wychmicini]TCO59587.1 OHCU decarboxylase [Actinocrispum wychmicini]
MSGDSWRVSPFNIQDGFDWPEPIEIIDSTLRKTLFTAGSLTTMDGFLRIADQLALAGVRHESLNVDWAGGRAPVERQLELLRAIGARDFGFTLNVYADTLLSDGRNPQPVGMRETAELLVDLGADTLAPGIVPAPDDDARARQLDELAELFDVAGSLGVAVTITLAQAGLRDFDELVTVANRAVELGAVRLDLMDSLSSLGPEAMKVFLGRFRQRVAPVPLTMHTHDDFGLATACTIAAATAGASPDVAVGGVSYRAGFAAMEEVVLALEVLYGVRTGIDMTRLTSLARTVAEESGVPISPLKPVVGAYAFLRHMPRDVETVLRHGPDAFPPAASCVSPHLVGAEMSWVWDSLSTDAMVVALGESLGLPVSTDEASTIRAALDREVAGIRTYPRWLTSDTAIQVFCRTLAGLRTSGIERFDAADHRRAVELLYACCGWARWADRLSVQRPFGDLDALLAAAGAELARLGDDALVDLVNKHPEIGAPTDDADLPAKFSTIEQASLRITVEHGPGLADLNDRYRARFGFTYLVAADGRTLPGIVDDIAERLGNPKDAEARVARAELGKIVDLRLRRMIALLDGA